MICSLYGLGCDTRANIEFGVTLCYIVVGKVSGSTKLSPKLCHRCLPNSAPPQYAGQQILTRSARKTIASQSSFLAFADRPRIRTALFIENVPPEDSGPGRALRQVVVPLRRDGLHLRKAGARDVREIVVLVVVPDVVSEEVQRAVVGVRLRTVRHIVLRDEVPGGRVDAP